MKQQTRPSSSLLTVLMVVLAFICSVGIASAMSDELAAKNPDAATQQKSYALFNQKCLSCHVSVADPERPGKTRDGWMVVVKFMDKHFVELTEAEADYLVDFLFALRPGTEKEPG